ncbi:nitrate reductase [Aliagarivorans marinus]|uniref:nitrate reductase n=1 Tax=Aliagarivorans marinus TaxID=561965 RepID=UPI00040D4F12|nr:nitrate reductase [Aliagarivorans marinus]
MAGTSWIKTTCPYCGTGCGVEARQRSDGTTQVRGDASHPTNRGLLCSKGSALGETVIEQGRLRQAMIKGHPEKLERALDYAASRLSQTIAEHGPDSVAFYVSGQLLTEDYYVANKLTKGFIGTANIDSNSRLCMSSAVAGHKRAFGEDLVPACYDDLEQADLVTLIGSNLAWCHPILFQRLKQAKLQRPEMKLVVIDPRRTDSCDIADLHLALRPGHDVDLFNGLLAYLADQQQLDQDYIEQHVDGAIDAIDAAIAQAGDIEALAERCGLSVAELHQFFQLFAASPACLSLFSQGVNQSHQGVDKVNAIINVHLATGKLGKPGSSAFSITGQPNAMGGREVGALSNLLAGHLDYTPTHLSALADYWQAPQLAQQPGLKAVDMFEALHSGKIKAIWIMGTNPAVSLPNASKIREALLACPLVIVSDCVQHTDTTRYADVLLPAAGWGEREGTVTNSERMLSRQRPFVEMQGDTKADWWLLSQVAKRMGFGEAFAYQHASEIFAEHAKLTNLLQDSEPRGLDISLLAEQGQAAYQDFVPVSWPLGSDSPRLFADGSFSTANGRAKMLALQQLVLPQPKPGQLLLNTGRVRDQWHTMTRTGLAPQLGSHSSEPLLDIAPIDAQSLGLSDTQLVKVSSEQGELVVRLRVSDAQTPGQLFMPIHWSEQNSSVGTVSKLVGETCDPLSGQPAAKYSVVELAALEFLSEGSVLSREAIDGRRFASDIYWCEQKLPEGYLYTLASVQSPAEFYQSLKVMLTENGSQTLDYRDDAKQQYRCAAITGSGLAFSFELQAYASQGDQAWLESLLNQPVSEQVQRGILAGTSPEPSLGKVVCACHQVREGTIEQCIEQGADSVEAIGRSCSAGTNCGSCVSQLKTMLNREVA